MERFNLNTWLEDKSRKIVTRDGKPARIICYDVKKGKQDDYNVPIIALVDRGEEIGEMSYYYSEDGRFLKNPDQTHNFDLFFADEEDELTDFEKAIKKLIESCCNEVEEANITNAGAKEISSHLLDLARKEIEKENPYSGNQKQEWSEEDKSMYIRTLGILGKCYMGELPTKVEEELKWFKSITDKAQPQTNQYDKGYEDGYSAAKYNQWKPKKEELEALRKRTYFCEGIDANLDSLYTNLLKL